MILFIPKAQASGTNTINHLQLTPPTSSSGMASHKTELQRYAITTIPQNLMLENGGWNWKKGVTKISQIHYDIYTTHMHMHSHKSMLQFSTKFLLPGIMWPIGSSVDPVWMQCILLTNIIKMHFRVVFKKSHNCHECRACTNCFFKLTLIRDWTYLCTVMVWHIKFMVIW